MIVIDTSFKIDGFPNTYFYQVKGPLTLSDIEYISIINCQAILVFENTKYLSPEYVRMINNPRVRISVQGGLNYFEINKYREKSYVDRTIYKPNELASIIELMEKIERKIIYSWTDRQKALFVYKTLSESLHYTRDYEDVYVDGHDTSRSLSGLLYGSFVCAGFAMVFKEIMDRIGIPCVYQNLQHTHSWNILQLDGRYYGIDLTWDCSKNSNNQCSFDNFGLKPDFYAEYYHSTTDAEEKAYPLSIFQRADLDRDIDVITKQKSIEYIDMIPVQDSNNRLFILPMRIDVNGIYSYIAYVYGKALLIHTNKEPRKLYSIDIFHCIENNGLDPELLKKPEKKFVTYQRYDESNFFIKKSKSINDEMTEFYYYDIEIIKGKPSVRKIVILSEMDLSKEWEDSMNIVIANRLLSRERVERKATKARGYVGYAGSSRTIFYDSNFERDKLHIINHI